MTTTPSLKHVANIAPEWVSQVTAEDIQSFLAFWQSLSHQERVIWVWSDVFLLPSGLIGSFLDTNDVQQTNIGLCGGPDCWVYGPRSQRVQEILDGLQQRWSAWAKDSGVVEVPIDKWPYKQGGPIAIEPAFKYIVGAVLSVGETDEGGYRQMRAVLLLDLPRLKTLVTQWVGEHQTYLRPSTSQVPF